MPPNGNAGASTKSNFSKGNGRAKYDSIHDTARAFSAMSVSRSASFARDLRAYTLIERPSITDVFFSHGPAANVMRYVLIGFVSVNRTVVVPGSPGIDV